MQRHHAILAAVSGFVIIAAAGLGWVFGGQPGGLSSKSRIADIGGPFTLIDDSGTPVSDAALRGKPTVMYFGYTFCPEVCPTTLTNLSRWMQALGPQADQLNYVFVTVDPQRDTLEVMHAYVSAFDPRIRGFTGTPQQIAAVAGEYRVYYRRVPTSDGGYVMDHSAALYLMDAAEKFVGLIDYQENDASALAKLRKLVTPAPSS